MTGITSNHHRTEQFRYIDQGSIMQALEITPTDDGIRAGALVHSTNAPLVDRASKAVLLAQSANTPLFDRAGITQSDNALSIDRAFTTVG